MRSETNLCAVKPYFVTVKKNFSNKLCHSDTNCYRVLTLYYQQNRWLLAEVPMRALQSGIGRNLSALLCYPMTYWFITDDQCLNHVW